MFITFKRDIAFSSAVSSEIESNEYAFESESYSIFIDSNLPLKNIEKLCQQTTGDKIDHLLDYLKYDGVLIAFHKPSGQVIIQRDKSGLASVYFVTSTNELIFSSGKHRLAQHFQLPMRKSSIQQWLTFDYVWDGQTFYDGLQQVLCGQKIVFDNEFKVKHKEVAELHFSESENNGGEDKNIRDLRTEIVKAHKYYLREKNVVFLSGGIDSVAMLIALDDLVPKAQIECHSFKVKSTQQDETEYAKSAADFLRVDLKIIERDITGEITPDIFKEKINRLNNPYPGIWIFSNQIIKNNDHIYYAGQDTRLHTPALNSIDKLAFNLFSATSRFRTLIYLGNGIMRPVQVAFDILYRRRIATGRAFRGLRRLSYITNTREYLLRYYFKCDFDQLKENGLPIAFYRAARKSYHLDLNKIYSARALYNYVVSVKWKEQYVNDIRYMIDMVKDQGGRLAMPFYNADLAYFSSSIPFELANKSITGKGGFNEKKVKVNKFVLRQALKDKIDDKTYFRAKAVSSTFHILYSQGLADILRHVINEDLAHPKSLIAQLDLKEFIQNFLNIKRAFNIDDETYLLKVYDLCCLIIYARGVNYKVV